MVKRGGRARGFIAMGATAALIGPAWGYDFKAGEYIDGSLISLITGGFSQRLRDQNFNLIAAPGPNSTGFTNAAEALHTLRTTPDPLLTPAAHQKRVSLAADHMGDDEYSHWISIFRVDSSAKNKEWCRLL